MIRPEDADYHVKPDTHWQWAETYFFPVQVPGTTINGGIYARSLRYRGVVMIGATIHRVGTATKVAPSGASCVVTSGQAAPPQAGPLAARR